ncbi:MAG TPA: bifunctional [glutamine synthetase] adenylyltransferase/[glutamine synthetase]-adenylyl-L-tyrosine phosphorylase [Actinomycetota bacterium]|nr:bifunctional [glutamine synthetase] adenylyltransferase/[glutamine synthetase]-adenylyl-L-tyrosine phosphorylase [Actinomycetota bacterium]
MAAMIDPLVAQSPDPAAVARALERLAPGTRARLDADPGLARAAVAVMAVSRSLTRLITVDAGAVEVLADLDARPPLPDPGEGPEAVARWKQHEQLRIAARDLLGVDALPAVGAALAALATDVLEVACRIADTGAGLGVIGMGKLGGRELNYASDVDVIFVGEANPLPVMEIARRCFRVDTNLRPEGRSGRLVLPLAAYEAYWDRWAKPWEFQALLKARPVAGDPRLGAAFAEAASTRVWQRPFGVDDLRALREMKARAEQAVARRGLSDREVKRGRGGIRDAEFAVQILQLVHGRADAALRSPNTLAALGELAAAGYVDPADAKVLADGYTFLRTVEHRLQLDDDQQVHAVPEDPVARGRLARVMGYRDAPTASALARFDEHLGRHQRAVRLLHERLYFRPLLDAFTDRGTAAMGPEAVGERLAAFGFADRTRTRSMLAALTKGLTRSSRLMEQMLPLILDWLSTSPDPDLGLVGLSTLAGEADRVPGLVATFRDSPEAARRLCVLLGTSRFFHRRLEQQPEMLAALAGDLRPRDRAVLDSAARNALAWRPGTDARREALLRLKRAESLRVAAADVAGLAETAEVGAGLAALAEASLQAALDTVAGDVALAVIGMGRLGGAELSYASDLDVIVVSGAASPADGVAANAEVEALLRLVQGPTPVARLYTLDLGLRPEGRSGALSRTVEAFRSYYGQWAKTWERQALVRARPVCGDPGLGARFMATIEPWVWGPLGAEEVREIRRMKARIERERIPPREDPRFHLKLGKGSLSDVEWTVQLLQLTHQVRGQNTMAALAALEQEEVISRPDARALAESYRFCERTRNRLALINSLRATGSDALPADPELLARLARSLGTTGPGLRDRYRQVTRRARAVMERLFYAKE